VDELAAAGIGCTFNQYAVGPRAPLLRERLVRYLEERAEAPVLLVGEAPGYRGARVSGIPFTSERQLSGEGPAEATATIVHRVLGELGLEDEVLLWNVVPTHPGTESSNRRPTRAEVAAGLRFVRRLSPNRRVVAVGRIAESALGCAYVRHPSRGRAHAFRDDVRTTLSLLGPARMRAPNGRPPQRPSIRLTASPHPPPDVDPYGSAPINAVSMEPRQPNRRTTGRSGDRTLDHRSPAVECPLSTRAPS
jgi:uracil-DNA glycosylase